MVGNENKTFFTGPYDLQQRSCKKKTPFSKPQKLSFQNEIET